MLLVQLTCVCATPISGVQFSEEMPDSDAQDDGVIVRTWPFCPTDWQPCGNGRGPLWVRLEVDPDAYTARVRSPHDTPTEILEQSRKDTAPVLAAIKGRLGAVASDKERAAFAQGLVQGIQYATDDNTGWVEYPRYALEFVVDQQGDCDDAAIVMSVLLEGLGLKPWLVRWRSASKKTGHLSTAVTRTGGLRHVTPPPGSDWVEWDGDRLLHVDGVGTPTGCRVACAPLGWNQWTRPPRDMRVVGVVRTTDPGLDAALPLSAWNNGGRDKHEAVSVDRRRLSRGDILTKARPTAERKTRRLRRRLKRLGISKTAARQFLERIRAEQKVESGLYLVLSVAGGVVLFAITLFAVRARFRAARIREQAAAARKERRY